MTPTVTTRLLVVAALVVVLVGVVDAAWSREWDLFTVVLVASALLVAVVGRLESRRPAVPVRRDLVAWYRERADLAGEPLPDVLDRALAAYRDRYGQAPTEPEVRG